MITGLCGAWKLKQTPNTSCLKRQLSILNIQMPVYLGSLLFALSPSFVFVFVSSRVWVWMITLTREIRGTDKA
jgi:hypothetical protein